MKNGTVVQRSGSTIIVRTDEGVRMFSQGEVDKRGVKIMRDGKPAQLSDFREGDRLSATIITSKPPRVMTEKEVQATLAAAAGSSGGAASGAGTGGARRGGAAAAGAAPRGTSAQAQRPPAARTLPKTASSWPSLGSRASCRSRWGSP